MAPRNKRPPETVEQEREALLFLALLGRKDGGAFQKDLVPEPTPALRQPLERKGLVRRVRRGRSNWIEVTDKGWDWAGTHLAAVLPEDAPGAGAVLRLWLSRLQDFLGARSLTLADLLAPAEATAEVSAAPPASGPTPHPAAAADLPARIRTAYLAVTGGRLATRALLKDIRPRLPDVPREVLDETLKQLQRDQAVILYRLDNSVELTEADHAAALHIAGEPRHILWIRA
ncbi:hypothetical protein [Xanthobacter sediminis]